MSRTIVTGASGFIGLPLVAELGRRGHDVHALHTRPTPPALPGVCWHRVDLAAAGALEALMRELAPERLVHLAWYVEHGRVWNAVENLIWVERSLRLMRSFASHGGRRLLLLGTCAEYDWSDAARPLSESHSRPAPATLYGASKDALRRLAGAFAAQQELELAWGRPFFLYGPRESPLRLVPSVIRSLLAEEAPRIASAARVRDFMYVEDVAGALVALLESPVVGEVNIATGRGTQVGAVVKWIAQLLRRPVALPREAPIRGDPAAEPASLVADVARLRHEVGYRPRWTIARGLEQTVHWWLAQPPPAGCSQYARERPLRD